MQQWFAPFCLSGICAGPSDHHMHLLTGVLHMKCLYAMLHSWPPSLYELIGATTYTGVDDTRLFVWPNKGIYALTGRHAEVPKDANDTSCKQFNWMQYLAQVGEAGPSCVHAAQCAGIEQNQDSCHGASTVGSALDQPFK